MNEIKRARVALVVVLDSANELVMLKEGFIDSSPSTPTTEQYLPIDSLVFVSHHNSQRLFIVVAASHSVHSHTHTRTRRSPSEIMSPCRSHTTVGDNHYETTRLLRIRNSIVLLFFFFFFSSLKKHTGAPCHTCSIIGQVANVTDTSYPSENGATDDKARNYLT